MMIDWQQRQMTARAARRIAETLERMAEEAPKRWIIGEEQARDMIAFDDKFKRLYAHLADLIGTLRI